MYSATTKIAVNLTLANISLILKEWTQTENLAKTIENINLQKQRCELGTSNTWERDLLEKVIDLCDNIIYDFEHEMIHIRMMHMYTDIIDIALELQR
jgi:hypothetical protein